MKKSEDFLQCALLMNKLDALELSEIMIVAGSLMLAKQKELCEHSKSKAYLALVDFIDSIKDGTPWNEINDSMARTARSIFMQFEIQAQTDALYHQDLLMVLHCPKFESETSRKILVGLLKEYKSL